VYANTSVALTRQAISNNSARLDDCVVVVVVVVVVDVDADGVEFRSANMEPINCRNCADVDRICACTEVYQK
jgi:hypothetical protein